MLSRVCGVSTSRMSPPRAVAPGARCARPGRTAGVTLLECLVCCAIAVVALTMGVEALRVCRSINARSQVLSALTLAAQDDLARAASLPFDSLTSGTTQTPRILSLPVTNSTTEIPVLVQRQVVPLDGALTEITVRAEWRGGKEPVAISMTTRVTREGGSD